MVNIELIFVVLGVILVSMTLHEVMHGFMAYWLGDDTAKHLGRLTLNPIKHIDPFMTILLPLFLIIAGGPVFGGAKPVPFNPVRLRYGEWGMALVALAGPLTNIVLAFLGYGLMAIMGISDSLGSSNIVGWALGLFVQVNLGFAVFNLLPLPPLDGSRVLYALAPEFVRESMDFVEQRFGIMPVFVIILLANSLIIAYITWGVESFVSLFSWIFGVV